MRYLPPFEEKIRAQSRNKMAITPLIIVMMDLAILSAEAVAGMYKKPIEAMANAHKTQNDHLPRRLE